MRKFICMCLLCAATVMWSCSDYDYGAQENSVPKKTTYTLYNNGTATISGFSSNLNWESDNEFVATVKGNTINAGLVGTAKLSASSNTISVTVGPKYELPIAESGACRDRN